MSSLFDRTNAAERGTLHEHLGGLTARLPERPRQLQEVTLTLIDGTQVSGILHRAHGTRTLDFLNRQAETFVAMTDALLSHGETTSHVPFIALNKAHIVGVIEGADAE